MTANVYQSAHDDGALGALHMNAIADWPRNAVRMTPISWRGTQVYARQTPSRILTRPTLPERVCTPHR